jgi:hypothetical protein
MWAPGILNTVSYRILVRRGRIVPIINVSIAKTENWDHVLKVDILLVGPVLALSIFATLITGKAALRGFVAVLERRGRGTNRGI